MHFSRSRLPYWLSFLLVWALLWTPLWAHWHRIAHSTPQGHTAPAGLHTAQAVAKAGIQPELGGHDAGSELCQVLDHLAHAERLSTAKALWTAPKLPARSPSLDLASAAQAHRWSPAQARAPPALI